MASRLVFNRRNAERSDSAAGCANRSKNTGCWKFHEIDQEVAPIIAVTTIGSPKTVFDKRMVIFFLVIKSKTVFSLFFERNKSLGAREDTTTTETDDRGERICIIWLSCLFSSTRAQQHGARSRNRVSDRF